jgi:ppGpp synthetase/RelA/SpoT-type nucleotidyltranferase
MTVTDRLLVALEEATELDYRSGEGKYEASVAAATAAVERSEFFHGLEATVEHLRETRIAGKIRGLETWSDGSEFRVVPKSWDSVVDKLYRINCEENRLSPQPPLVRTIDEQASDVEPRSQRWITPELAHTVIDDLIRTKIVVPFVDQVALVGDEITELLNRLGLRRIRRYHAKDSGYHARHYYALIDVPGWETVSFEVKILTKMQDTLGELTHILYEKQRTGELPRRKKRSFAWEIGTPDFLASYLGHGGHFIEAAICDLKKTVEELQTRDE